MIELLYAVIIVFGVSLFFYFIFPTVHFMKVYLYSFQLLLWILLMSLNQYKNHYLWDEPDFNSIHELPYPPINDINIIYDDSNSHVSDIQVAYSNKVFSLIETEEYLLKDGKRYNILTNEEITGINNTLIRMIYTFKNNNNVLELGSFTVFKSKGLPNV